VLASRLAEDANRTILVIEAGGFPTTDPNIEVPIFADIVRNSDEFNWRYKTVPQKNACKGHVDQVHMHCTVSELRLVKIETSHTKMKLRLNY